MELIPALDVQEEVRYQEPEKTNVFHQINCLRKYIFFSKLQAIFGNYYVEGFKIKGIKEDWISGTGEYWKDGKLEYWNFGMMEYWNVGMMEYWIDVMLE
jgi:hypothetical protein